MKVPKKSATTLLGHAIAIAATEFETTLDKGGQPYILHCLTVMNAVRHLGHEAMVVAVLHDLFEDCPGWGEHRLLDLGFDMQTAFRIRQLTRIRGEDYLEEYIPRVAQDDITRAIKLADLTHNLDPTRLRGLTKEDFDRTMKYHRAYAFLGGNK